MNDKDFFIKLHQDYPLAMQYMADNFKCLYTVAVNPPSRGGMAPATYGKIKHPLKRDLYDFFDEEEIFISINREDHDFKKYFDWDILHDKQYKVELSFPETRSEAETKAFEQAFEILELRLTKE